MRSSLPALISSVLLAQEAQAVLQIVVQDLQHETCSYANGSIIVLATGGVPPYSYSWSDGPTTDQRAGLGAGSYTVTVTDAALDQASITVDLFSYPYALMAIANGLPWCGTPGNAFNDPLLSGSTSNWTVNGSPTGTSPGGVPTFLANPWDVGFTYTIDDGNGCSGTITGTNGPQITDWPMLGITGIEPSCTDQSIGAIHVHSASLPTMGGFGPWVDLIRDDGVPQYQAYSPDPLTYDLSFEDLEPGYYGIHWWLGLTAEDLDPGQCTYDTIWVTVPSLGNACGSVQGTSFIDLNGDCVMNANEVGVPYSPMLVQPGDEAVLTNGFGQFAFGLPNGSYTLEQTDQTLVPNCPATQPVPFTVNSNATIIDLANSSTESLDLAASIACGVFRPGFDSHYHLLAVNSSPQQSGVVTATLTLDPALTFVSSEITPTSQNGNTLTWDLGTFTSFRSIGWNVIVGVPASTSLGTPLSSTLSIGNSLPDANASNDSDTQASVVVGSFDPNDKHAQTSTRASGTLYFIDLDEWVDYTIRFQNTGTFPADRVVITDTIAPELDMLSFEQGTASHPFTVTFKPGRVVEWRFDDIQRPDSASDELRSHGLVKFRIRPYAPQVPGSVIENIANIYFDFNEPVITEPSVLVAEFSTGTRDLDIGSRMVLAPNPTNGLVWVKVDAAGDRNGSLRVLAMDGRLLLDERMTGQRTLLDLTELGSGAYLLEWTGNEGARLVMPIIRD